MERAVADPSWSVNYVERVTRKTVEESKKELFEYDKKLREKLELKRRRFNK